MGAVIGIDPGASGALALLPSEGEPVAVDYPGDVTLAADILRGWRLEHEVRLVALEQVHSMPKQGVKSTFSLGRNLGAWEGVLAGLGLPYVMVGPQEWQRGLVRPSDGDSPKERALTVARRLFPTVDLSRKGDDGRADALLLAWWARKSLGE